MGRVGSGARRRTAAAALVLLAVAVAAPQLAAPPSLERGVRAVVERHDLDGAVVAYGVAGTAPTVAALGVADGVSGRPMRSAGSLQAGEPLQAGDGGCHPRALRRRHLHDRDTPRRSRTRRSRRGPGAPARDGARPAAAQGGWDRRRSGDPFFRTPAELPAAIAEKTFGECGPVVDALAAAPLAFEPGTAYAYSNVGSCWLGRIVVAAGGDGSAPVVRRLVPATSGLRLSEAAVTVRHPVPADERSFIVNRAEVAGAFGGWVGSAEAYFAFAATAMADRRVIDRPLYARGRSHYGLGWRVWPLSDRTVLTRYGAMPGAFGELFDAVAKRRAWRG